MPGPFYPPNLSASVLTTDATAATLLSVEVPTNQSITIDADVTGRRTGGSSGASGDSAYYELKATAKNVAGTVTLLPQGAVFTSEDQDYWSCVADVSGTALRIRVTGAADNNIAWTATYKVV